MFAFSAPGLAAGSLWTAGIRPFLACAHPSRSHERILPSDRLPRRQPGRPVRLNRHGSHSPAARHVVQDPPIGFVVVNHQHGHILQAGNGPRCRDLILAGCSANARVK